MFEEKTDCSIRKLHDFSDELFLSCTIRLSGNHIANCFVEGMDLRYGEQTVPWLCADDTNLLR